MRNVIWIQRDLTEAGIASELVELGVPKTDIVLGFRSPCVRQFTEFAESQIISACGYHAADELLQQINIQNLSAVQLAKILEIEPLPIPVTEPPLFKNKSVEAVPTAALMAASLRAQIRPDLWYEAASSIAVFQHEAKGNSNNYIEHYISSPGDITLLPWNEAQQIIDKFGFTSAKLHIIFAAHTMKQETPWHSSFTLKASDIVEEMGWDKNHKKTHIEKLLEIANTAFALDCLLVKAVWFEGMNHNPQKLRARHFPPRSAALGRRSPLHSYQFKIPKIDRQVKKSISQVKN